MEYGPWTPELASPVGKHPPSPLYGPLEEHIVRHRPSLGSRVLRLAAPAAPTPASIPGGTTAMASRLFTPAPAPVTAVALPPLVPEPSLRDSPVVPRSDCSFASRAAWSSSRTLGPMIFMMMTRVLLRRSRPALVSRTPAATSPLAPAPHIACCRCDGGGGCDCGSVLCRRGASCAWCRLAKPIWCAALSACT